MNRFSFSLGRVTKKIASILLLLNLLLAMGNVTTVHAAAIIDNTSIGCSSGTTDPTLYSSTTIPAGRHILLAVNTSPAATVTVTNTMGSSFALVQSVTSTTFVKTNVYIAQLVNPMTASSSTISINTSFNSAHVCAIAIAGLEASPVDGSAVGSNAWSTAMSTASVTPTTTNSLLVGVFGWSTNVYKATPGSGWTEQKEDPNGAVQIETRQVAAGTYAASATLDYTDRWAGVLVALKIRTPLPPTDITLSNSIIMTSDPAGTLVGTLAAVDPDVGETYTFSLVSGTGSTNNGSFTITGNQLTNATALAAGTYSIRVNVNDGTSGNDFAKIFSITVTAYPPITGGDTSYNDYITNVTFSGINNTSDSSAPHPGYQDFTSFTGTVTQGTGSSLSVTVIVGDPVNYPQYIKVWFDWNQDNDFNDVDEGYIINANASTTGPHTVTINVPATATVGATRMRIVNNGDGNPSTPPPNSGVATFYGQAEDYTINVQLGLAVSIAPTAVQTINVATNGTALAVTETPAADSRQWKYGTTAGGPYSTNISGATGTSYTPNFATAGTYYVVCASTKSGNTVNSNEVRVNVVTPAVITFGAAPTPNYLGGNFTVSATTTNTDSSALTYSYVSGPCAFVSGSTFSSSGAGTCVVQADGAATANFSAASQTQSVTIAKATPVVTFGAAPTPTYPGSNFTVNATTTNTDSGTLTYSYVSGPCSFVSGATFSPTGVGTCVVQADGAATTNFNAASQTQSIIIGKATPVITFDPAPSPTYLGGNFTVNAATTNTDSGTLTYSWVSGPCAWVSGATFSSSGAGTCVVQADGAATTNFNAALQTQSITIGKNTPVITFGAAPTVTYLGGNFTVNAITTNTDSGTLIYSYVSGPCAFVSGSTFSSTGAGTCVVQADGAATTNFNAASQTQSVTIGKVTPVITFGAAPTPTYPGGNFTVSATTTNTDSGALSYSYVSGPCSFVSGATFSPTGVGTCVVQADGAATTNFNAALQTQSITISKTTPVITFDPAPSPTYLGGNFTVNATTTNTDSGALTYSYVSGPCAFVSGATFSSSGAGACVVQADGAATTNFNAASQTQSITISKTIPVITFGAAPTVTYLGGNFTVTATTTNTDSSALTYSYVSGPCAFVSGSTFSSSGAGTCVVQADGAATANFSAASQTQSVTIGKATPVVTFGAAPTPTYPGSNFTVNATTTNTDSGTLSYSYVSGPCSFVSGATFSPTGVGTCVVQADGAATTSFNAALQTQSITISKTIPVITFDPAPSPTYLGGNFTVNATTTNTDSSTLTYSQVSGPCAWVSGATFSSTGAGTCVVQADGAATTNFNAASQTQSITIGKATPVVTFGAAPTPTYLGGNFTVSATTTNTDSGALTYSYVSGSCAFVSGATFSTSGAGTCVVQADGAATANFNAASQTQSITIGKATPVVTFGAAPTPTYPGGNFTVSATTTNTDSGALTYSYISGPCTFVSGATFSPTGVGTCVVQAGGAATTSFNAASQTQSVTISKTTPVITFDPAPSPTYLGGNFTVNATTTNTDSGTLTYSRVSGPCAWVSGATFSSSGAGTCVVQASGAATINFNAASQTQSITIGKATQTINLTSTAPVAAVVGGTKYIPTATATSALPVTFTIDIAASTVCSISGAQVSFLSIGTCVINANQAGNTNYDAALQTQQSFAVGIGTPVITWNNPASIVTGTALGGAQLNATANVGGAFIYTPAAGVILPVGTHSLHVDFTPADAVNYIPTSKDVSITVTSGGGGGGGGGLVPTIIASDGTYLDKVNVTWTPVSGASYYLVYRSESLGGVKIPTSGYRATNLGGDDVWTNPGMTYYYWVRACDAISCGDFSAPDTGWQGLPAPVISASDGAFPDKVQVSFPAVNWATSYLAYRSLSQDGVKIPTDGYFTIVPGGDDLWAAPGVTYYYWVKACNGPNCSVLSAYDTGWR